jgi:hypothetical protein
VSADCAFRHGRDSMEHVVITLSAQRVNPASRIDISRVPPASSFWLRPAGLSRRENVVVQTPGAAIDCLVAAEKALGVDRFMDQGS